MKIIDADGNYGDYFACYWVRLFSFGKDEEERALLDLTYEKTIGPGFYLRAQVGGDVFAELSACVGKYTVTVSIWSV